MKALIAIFSLLLFSFSINAQILEKESNMSLGVQTGNEVILDDISAKVAANLWEDYFKDKYREKVKRNKKANEYYTTGVRINRIYSVSNIDIYSKFDERGSSCVMSLWVDLGMAFVNSAEYNTEYKAIVEMMEDFRVFARTYVVQEEYDNAEKTLEKMKKDLDKLEKQNGKLHDKIASYEEKILEAKDNISLNEVEQEDQKISIDRQIEVLKEIQTRLSSIKKQ